MKSFIRSITLAAGVSLAAAALAQPAPTTPRPMSPASSPPAANAASDARHSMPPASGEGRVWVNPTSKIYYCTGSADYGKTKTGEYMTEAAAKAAGHNADRGMGCAK